MSLKITTDDIESAYCSICNEFRNPKDIDKKFTCGEEYEHHTHLYIGNLTDMLNRFVYDIVNDRL